MSPPRRSGPGRKLGSYTQAERVLGLVETLRRGGIVRVSEDARSFGVSIRQLQRDLGVIRSQPGLVLEQLEDGAWKLDRGAVSSRERRARRAAVLAMTIGEKLSSSLWGSRLSKELRARIDALVCDLGQTDTNRLTTWSRRIAVVAPGQKDYAHRPEIAARLEQLLDAMVHCCVVSVGYRSHRRALSGEPARELNVQPLGLVHYRDGVYFIVKVVGGLGAQELLQQQILLALDRIEDVRSLGETFSLPPGFDAQEFLGSAFGIWRESEEFDVVVEVAAGHAPRVRERRIHSSQRIEERTDGSLLVCLRVAGLHEVTDWILTLGEFAEVIQPPALRAHVASRLKAAAAQYD